MMKQLGPVVRRTSKFISRPVSNAAISSSHEQLDSSIDARPFEEIPALPKVPFLKASWNYLPLIGKYDPTRFHHVGLSKHKEFGRILREEHPFGLNIVSIVQPDDIEALFRNEGKYPFRGFLESLKIYRLKRKDVFENPGLLVLQHEEWHELRSQVQKHMLRPKAVAAYLPLVDDVAQELVNNMKKLRDSNGEIPNFVNELYKWALESICLVALDRRVGCLKEGLLPDSEPQRMIQAIQQTFQGLSDLEQSVLKLYKFIPTPKWKKFEKAQDFFTETGVKYVSKALERLKETADEDREMTFLETLLMTKDFKPKHAVTMICDMIMAGVDTTSHATGFVFYHLAKNPEAQQKAFNEIEKVLPRPGDSLTVQKLQELPYMKACVKEALRLSPVVVGTVRKLESDTVLAGYRIPAGVHVICQAQVASKLEKYFPNPERFLPERWLVGKDQEKPHPFGSIPFSFGTRMCVGRRIAEQEIWTLVTKVVRNFRMEYHYEDIDQISRTVNIPDKPFRIQFFDR